MKCVVTGANGFIGQSVVGELARRGFDVVAFDLLHDDADRSSNIRCVKGDVRNLELLKTQFDGANCIFHLSGVVGTDELFDDPKLAIEVNICGALNIFLAAKEMKRPARIFLPTKHTEPNNIYSMTAQGVDKLGHVYRENCGLDVRALILPNVYGPFQNPYRPRRVVPQFIARAIANDSIEIFGSGDQLVELVFVSDVGRIIVDYLIEDVSVIETFELFAQDVISIRSLAKKIIRISNSRSEITYASKRRGELILTAFSRASNVVDVVGPVNLTALDDGIEITMDWYKRKYHAGIQL